MRLRDRLSRRGVAMAAGAILTAGLGYLLHDFRVGLGLTHLSFDLLPILRGDVAASGVMIVHLDEKSHRELHQPLNAPWDRALHARLIERLTRAGARAIVFDIVFSDPATDAPEADQLLARAMKASGRVILGVDNVPTGRNTRRMLRPFDLLLDSSAGMGSVEVMPGPDLIVREHTPDEQWAGLRLPSLGAAAAEFLGVPPFPEKRWGNAPRWLNYYGPPNFLPGLSYADALDSNRVSDAVFRDQVVFVGARLLTKFASDRKDEYRSPFSYWATREMVESGALFMSGVELQATAFLNQVRGDWLVRMPFALERALMLVLGALLGAALVCFRPVTAAGLALVGWLLTTVCFYLLYRHGLIWFPWLVVWGQIFLALSWSVLFNSVQWYAQKRVYEHTLALYLSPKLVKRFARHPSRLRPGAEKQTLTILFSDIAGFTSLSEGMDSDELARVMNVYFQTAVSRCIHATDGTVVKYIGDAIFAFWNAPEPQPDHAVRACRAALLLARQAPVLLNGRPLLTRLGLHTGVANVGNFGSTDRVDYTALGENVNLASRLEGVNKPLGTQCVISGTTQREVGERFVTRRLGLFRLRGLDKPVDLHELVGLPEEAQHTLPWRESFAAACGHYRRQHWAAAEAAFRQTLELRPEDGPAKFYLAALPGLRGRKVPDHWSGELDLGEK